MEIRCYSPKIWGAVSLLFVSMAIAQQEAVGLLSMEQACQMAVRQNPQLLAELEDIGLARAELMQASRPENPELELGLRVGDSEIGKELSVTQDLSSLFFLMHRRSIAKTGLAIAQQKSAARSLHLLFDVQVSFLALQAALQKAELHQTILAAAALSENAARRLRQAGNSTKLEFTSEQVLHEEAKLQLLQAQTEISIARAELAQLLGLSSHANWSIEGRLPELPDTPEMSIEILEDKALAERTDLLAARLEVQRHEKMLALAKQTRWLPGLHAGLKAEQEPEGDWVTGPTFSLSLPLLDQGQATVQSASSGLRKAQYEQTALELKIRSAVQAGHARLAAARQKAEQTTKTLLPLRQQILDETQLEYNAMQVGLFPLLEAKRSLVAAGIQKVDALLEYWIARAELARTVGLPPGEQP